MDSVRATDGVAGGKRGNPSSGVVATADGASAPCVDGGSQGGRVPVEWAAEVDSSDVSSRSITGWSIGAPGLELELPGALGMHQCARELCKIRYPLDEASLVVG